MIRGVLSFWYVFSCSPKLLKLTIRFLGMLTTFDDILSCARTGNDMASLTASSNLFSIDSTSALLSDEDEEYSFIPWSLRCCIWLRVESGVVDKSRVCSLCWSILMLCMLCMMISSHVLELSSAEELEILLARSPKQTLQQIVNRGGDDYGQ